MWLLVGIQSLPIYSFSNDCMEAMQKNNFKKFLDCSQSLEGPGFSSQSLILIALTRDQISPVYLTTSTPRTEPWHRGQLAKNRLHPCYLPYKCCNKLITSKVPTRNGTLPAPELSTGQNLCQQLF